MKTGKRYGQTLIEVMMATIVAAMTTTAIFSVILSSFASQAKADKREAVAMVLKRAQETIKSYVSAVPTDAGRVPVGALGVGVWTADTSGVWPLRDGVHTITSLLAGTPLASATSVFSYNVTSGDCGFGLGAAPNYALACKAVVFTLTYPD